MIGIGGSTTKTNNAFIQEGWEKMNLSKKIVDIVERNGFTIHNVEKQGSDYYIEMGQCSEAGEDWWETIWFDGTNEGFVKAVRERANTFDVDEECKVYIECRGTHGVPSSIRTLIEDAEWKANKLEELADVLSEN